MTDDFNPESVHTGSSFEDFLDEEGIRNEVEGTAIKRVLERAAREGKSLDQWVRSALEERVRLGSSAKEFFRMPFAGATGQTLRWALDNGPDRPPDSGDEL